MKDPVDLDPNCVHSSVPVPPVTFVTAKFFPLNL